MVLRSNPNPPPIHIGADEITKSDSVVNQWSGIYVGGTGDLKVTMRNGDVVVFESIPAGTILPIATTLVWSTGTTATKLVGFR